MRYLRFLLAIAVFAFSVQSHSINKRILQGPPQEPHAVMLKNWKTDLETVLKTTKNNGKRLLVLFTGSDWCSPCKALEQKVLSHPGFLEKVKGRYELVMIDLPSDKKRISSVLYKANKAAISKYSVDSYPTLYMLDHLGRPLGLVFSYPLTIEHILDNINVVEKAANKRDRYLKLASEEETGNLKAILISEAFKNIKVDNTELKNIQLKAFYSEELELLQKKSDLSQNNNTEISKIRKEQKLLEEQTKLRTQYKELMDDKSSDRLANIEKVLSASNHPLQEKYYAPLTEHLSVQLMQQGNFDEAEKVLKRCLNLNRAKAWINLFQEKIRKIQNARKNKTLQQLQYAEINDPLFYEWLEKDIKAEQRFKELQEWVKKPMSPINLQWSMILLARAYKYRGDLEAAKQWYHNTLKVKGVEKSANSNLARLELKKIEESK